MRVEGFFLGEGDVWSSGGEQQVLVLVIAALVLPRTTLVGRGWDKLYNYCSLHVSSMHPHGSASNAVVWIRIRDVQAGFEGWEGAVTMASTMGSTILQARAVKTRGCKTKIPC